LPGAISANTYGEAIYGLPLFVDSGMLYYRADLLERYGLSPPQTWPELVSHARTIVSREQQAGKFLYGFSGQFKQYEGLVCNMMEYVLGNRGSLGVMQTDCGGISDLPALEAVRFVRDEIIGGLSPRGVLTYEEPESLALFIQGRAVFHRNWPYAWEAANNAEQSRVAGCVGISRLPCFPGGESRAALGGWQLGLSRFSCKKQKAWTFIHFLAGARVQKMLALQAGLAPTRTALYHDPEVLRAYPQFQAMREVFLTAVPRPKSPLYPSLSHVLQHYFSKVLADPRSDIEAEARAASREMAKIAKLAQGT